MDIQENRKKAELACKNENYLVYFCVTARVQRLDGTTLFSTYHQKPKCIYKTWYPNLTMYMNFLKPQGSLGEITEYSNIYL